MFGFVIRMFEFVIIMFGFGLFRMVLFNFVVGISFNFVYLEWFRLILLFGLWLVWFWYGSGFGMVLVWIVVRMDWKLQILLQFF